MDAVSAWKNLLAGKAPYFIAVAKAHFGFIHWIFTQKKDIPTTKIQKSNLKGLYCGCIVWDHFVLGKKSFKEIFNQTS